MSLEQKGSIYKIDPTTTGEAKAIKAAFDAKNARDETVQAKEEAETLLTGAIIVTGEGEDFFELKALEPSQLVDSTETIGGYEIEIVEIIQN